MVMIGLDIFEIIIWNEFFFVCFSRGLVLGIWSACASVGNIIGVFLVLGVLDYGYDVSYMISSLMYFIGVDIVGSRNFCGEIKFIDLG